MYIAVNRAFVCISNSTGESVRDACQCKMQSELLHSICLQILHCIRHGQSAFNAATANERGFADPAIFDARLTALGKQQVSSAQKALQSLQDITSMLRFLSHSLRISR